MKRERKPVFDPKAFLAKANGGRTISKYQQGQVGLHPVPKTPS